MLFYRFFAVWPPLAADLAIRVKIIWRFLYYRYLAVLALEESLQILFQSLLIKCTNDCIMCTTLFNTETRVRSVDLMERGFMCMYVSDAPSGSER